MKLNKKELGIEIAKSFGEGLLGATLGYLFLHAAMILSFKEQNRLAKGGKSNPVEKAFSRGNFVVKTVITVASVRVWFVAMEIFVMKFTTKFTEKIKIMFIKTKEATRHIFNKEEDEEYDEFEEDIEMDDDTKQKEMPEWDEVDTAELAGVDIMTNN